MDEELLTLIYATIYTDSSLLIMTKYPQYLPQYLV